MGKPTSWNCALNIQRRSPIGRNTYSSTSSWLVKWIPGSRRTSRRTEKRWRKSGSIWWKRNSKRSWQAIEKPCRPSRRPIGWWARTLCDTTTTPSPPRQRRRHSPNWEWDGRPRPGRAYVLRSSIRTFTSHMGQTLMQMLSIWRQDNYKLTSDRQKSHLDWIIEPKQWPKKAPLS